MTSYIIIRRLWVHLLSDFYMIIWSRSRFQFRRLYFKYFISFTLFQMEQNGWKKHVLSDYVTSLVKITPLVRWQSRWWIYGWSYNSYNLSHLFCWPCNHPSKFSKKNNKLISKITTHDDLITISFKKCHKYLFIYVFSNEGLGYVTISDCFYTKRPYVDQLRG